jgi:beta-lactamase regulating signal transducer with metallopeptidase domain/uncharacterized GH25 family protein
VNLTDFLLALGRNSAQAAVLVAVIVAVQAIFRRRLSPQWRAALWLLLVARLLLPFSSTSAVSIFNWVRWSPVPQEVPIVQAPAKPIAAVVSQRIDPAPEAAGVARERGQRTDAVAVAPRAATPSLTNSSPTPLAVSPARTALPISLAPTVSLTSAIFGAWLAGVMVLSGHLAWSAWRLRRRLAVAPTITDSRVVSALTRCAADLGVARLPAVLEAEFISSPALHGFWRPVLLLPSGFADRFSAQELRFVMLHELAHLKRRDLVLNWMIALLQVAHWFNPLVWFGFARWRTDREIACDALALAVVGVDRGREYGETILRLLDNFSLQGNGPAMVCVLEDKSQLRRRIQMIARFRPASRWSALAAVLIGAIGVVCLTDAKVAPPSQVIAPALSVEAAAPGSKAPVAATPQTEALALDLSPHGRLLTAPDSLGHIYDAIAGQPTFDGLPFNLSTAVILYGDLDGAMCGFPEQVSGIPVGRTFDELHLLHVTRNFEAPGTPVARIRLNYRDGSHHEFTIRYAYEVRKHTHTIYEQQESLLDTENTKIVWRSVNKGTGRNTNSRLIETTFRNPHPEREVVSLDAITTHSLASYAMLAATVSRTNPARPVTPGLRGQDGEHDTRKTFAVTVVDPSGKPVRDARVLPEFGNNAVDILATDANGRATVYYGAKTRQLTISVYVHGFSMIRGIWAPEYPEGAEFRLVKGTTIGGTLVDDEGKPRADLPITAYGADSIVVDAAPAPTVDNLAARTDVAGRWTITGVPDGFDKFVLLVAEGPVRTTFYPDSVPVSRRHAGEVVKTADFFAGNAILRMPRVEAIEGTVENEAGKPIAGAAIAAGLTGQYRPDVNVSSDENGHFSLRGIRSGENALVAKADGYAPITVAMTLPLKKPLKIQLKPEAPVVGRVTDSSGAPVAGVTIKFDGIVGQSAPWQTGGVAWQAETDEKGQFRWAGAPLANFRLSAVKRDLMRLPWIGVDDSNRQALHIQMGPVLQVTGVVTDAATGEPISKYRVVPGAPSGEAVPNLDPDNAHENDNVKGRYSLVIDRPLYVGVKVNDFTVAIIADGYEPAYSRSIRADEANVTYDFKLQKVSQVAGTIQTADGKPVAGATVVSVDDASSITLSGVRVGDIRGISKSVSTDAGGHFALTPNGHDYQIAVGGEAGFAVVPAVEFRKTRTITVRPWGRLEGRWLDWGEPIKDAAVRLSISGPEGAEFSLDSHAVDADGNFRFDHVPPGPVTLNGAAASTPWSSGEIWRAQIEPGATKSTTITTQLHAVTLRLKKTAGVTADISPEQCFVMLRANVVEPEPPPEADTPEKLREWAKRYRESDAGKALLATQPRYMKVSSDGTAQADLVPAGTYRIEGRLIRDRKVFAISDAKTVTIPDRRETTAIDLGEMTLHPEESSNRGEAASPGTL